MADDTEVQAEQAQEQPTEINRHLLDQVLDAIRPSLQADGGDMELVDVDDETGTVTLRLSGACSGCPLSSVTLSMGVERILKEHVPGVQRVKDVMEDAAEGMGGMGAMGMGMGDMQMGIPEGESLI